MDFLEYNDILCEQMGAMLPGKLRLTDRDVIFKYTKTGKTEQFPGKEIDLVNWQRMSGEWAIRIFLKSGDLYRFGGFKESDQEKINKFFNQTFKKEVLPKDLSLKGWNWGAAVFKGNTLSFDVDDVTSFEVPLSYVSQCTTGKNEVTMEFHQHEDAPISLMELRFHIPSTTENPDPTEAFQDQVMKKASVVTATGDVLAIFRQVQCLTPRGRYDIGIYPTFINMHGKTFDFKIPITTILRLFLLPHRDGRQMYFVLSLDPPIKQGLTRYHFLILRFDLDEDDEMDLELPISDDDLKTKYEGRLPKEIKGPAYEVMSKITKGLVNRKITVPGSFKGHSGTAAIACSYKAAAGLLYPLERGFMYVPKPPMHIRFEEIIGVNFARSGGTTRTFDFEIELKNSMVHTFSSIEKEEYGNLFSFAQEKKIRIKSKSGMEKGASYDMAGDEADPYLERMKREGEERDDEDSDEDESTDDDFNPDAEGGSDVAEEFDSNPESTDSEGGQSGDAGSGDDEKKAKKKKKKEKKEKKEKKNSSGEKERPKKKKKKKDSGAPKRPMSAYFLWLNEHREQIKEENPGISVTEVTKKAGEMWRELSDKTKWEKMNQEAKARYEEEMREWRASGGGVTGGDVSRSPKKKSPKKSVGSTGITTGGSGAGFKSKEYISDESSSQSDSDEKPLKKKPKAEVKDEPKSDKEDEDNDEEEAASTPASSEHSGGDSD